MSRLLCITIVVLLLAGCTIPTARHGSLFGGGSLTGSGNLTTVPFDLKGFTQIDADSGAQVQMARGDAFAVQVETDDNLVARLDVGVTGSTLHIRLQSGSYPNSTLRALVTMPKLTGVTLNGGSTLHGELDGEDLTVSLNGGSQATLTGTAGRVTIDVNGGSQALVGGLTAGDVTVSANGGATVVVGGSPTSVNVHADGGAQVITR